MSMNGPPSEITSKASRGRPEGGFLGLLRAMALIAVVAGAGGSLALMLRAGQRTPPSPAGTIHNLGALPVRGPPMGQQGCEALVGCDPSDALLRDARCHAGLFGHLR